MDKIKKMLPFLIVMALDFYILPFLIRDTGTAMIMLMVVMPLICLVCAAIYGAKYSFNLLFCVLVTILFVPSIFIFYNSSAWIYVVYYGIVGIIGNTIGMLFGNH